MGDFLARTGLRLYRAFGSAVYPFSGPFLRARARRGKEDRARRGERYGYASHARPSGPLVWFHAASVGESLAVLPLIEKLEAGGIFLVLTTGTVTSADIARDRLPERTLHQYVPMDMPKAIERFLDHWKPDLAVFAESEIWPNTLEELHKRNIPQALVNARLSDKSSKRWRSHYNLSQAIFSRMALVVAQSELDGQRFTELGAQHVCVSGNLKTDVERPVADAQLLEKLRQQIGNRPVWLAASTHDGEEESIAVTHRMLAQHVPNILTIIVPRHSDRRDDVLATLKKHGLATASRSKDETISAQTAVFLGDSMGEMGLYLALAPIAFMGKSLHAENGQGGQNPIEPALMGTAILSGRYVQNFRDTYQALLDAGGVRLVRDEKMLAATVLNLLHKPNDMRVMQSAAAKAVADMGGALDLTYRALEPYVLPLRVQAGLERAAALSAHTEQDTANADANAKTAARGAPV